MEIKSIIKRDGRVVPYDISKVAKAVEKAIAATGEIPVALMHLKAEAVAKQVEMALYEAHADGSLPNVEEIQDRVERELMADRALPQTAKAYP